MGSFTDCYYKSLYVFGKGQNDARKSLIKKCLLGGGGLVIPEYQTHKGKAVLSRQKKASIFLEQFFQTVCYVHAL